MHYFSSKSHLCLQGLLTQWQETLLAFFKPLSGACHDIQMPQSTLFSWLLGVLHPYFARFHIFAFTFSPHYFLQHSTIVAFTAFCTIAEFTHWTFWDVPPQKHCVSRWYSRKVKSLWDSETLSCLWITFQPLTTVMCSEIARWSWRTHGHLSLTSESNCM